MNGKVTRKTEYHVKEFMYGLGIKNSDLTVYAALYSFTVGERGLYHGAAAYLADSLGISVRTVRRAYSKLFALGLIERYATSDGRYVGVRCVMSRTEPKKCKLASKETSSVGEKRAELLPASAAQSNRADDICALINKKIISADAPDHEKNTFLMMKRYEKSGDNRRFLAFGKSGGVIMTEPQYSRLLELLPTEELLPYFVKLETMLCENIKTGRKPPHSHYKVIKKWIEEDTAL